MDASNPAGIGYRRRASLWPVVATVVLSIALAGYAATASHAQQPTSPVVGIGEPTNNPATQAQHDPQKQCVDDREFSTELISGRNPIGDAIVLPANFLAADERMDLGIRSEYADHARYFAALDMGAGRRYILFRQDVLTRRATEADALVQRRLLAPDQTIVSLHIEDRYAGWWNSGDLYLYTCGTSGSPSRVSRSVVRISPHWLSLYAAALVTVGIYIWVAFALWRKTKSSGTFLSALNPVRVAVGPDGRASLSKFQILSFSMAVFFLMLLYMMRNGSLSDLSSTILILLGINGVGATAAKGADAHRNTISAENRAWLLRRGWILSAKPVVDAGNATWQDFFTTGSEFDVYRYQSFIFSLLVLLALFAAGIGQLSTFAIPETVLGIVGLSQAVYIGGKLVTATDTSDLNAAISDLRDRERKFSDAATSAKHGPVNDLPEAIQLAGPELYSAYKDKAQDVAAVFTAQTGIAVSTAALEPKVGA